MKKIFLFTLFFMPLSLFAQETVVATSYYKDIFGLVHEHQDIDSASITGIMCGTKLQIVSRKNETLDPLWVRVKIGDDVGFVRKESLSTSMPKTYRDDYSLGDEFCFQGLYPKFFSNLNLSVSEQYYFGRLYDQYVSSESKVPVKGTK